MITKSLFEKNKGHGIAVTFERDNRSRSGSNYQLRVLSESAGKLKCSRFLIMLLKWKRTELQTIFAKQAKTNHVCFAIKEKKHNLRLRDSKNGDKCFYFIVLGLIEGLATLDGILRRDDWNCKRSFKNRHWNRDNILFLKVYNVDDVWHCMKR